ncbi:SH3BP5L family protein [Megaselia abdita]
MDSTNSTVDPRIQIELEKLNRSTDEINKFEVELDESKLEFQKLLTESATKIKQSSLKIGNAIETAKPYYEARLYATQLTKEVQKAHNNFERAKSNHQAAKEMVYLAEKGLGEKSTLDAACQEMLSHATSRVNESQLDYVDSLNSLKIMELKQEVANNRAAKLQSQLKGALKSSRPYYETRANYNGLLKVQREKIVNLESKVSESKMTYNEALKKLEQISEEIHKMRQDRKNYLNMLNEPSTQEREFPQKINSIDEYYDVPLKLSTKSSPIHQKSLDSHECPHLFQDFEDSLQISSSTGGGHQTSSGIMSAEEIDQWTEIRLTNSDSTSSGYSHNDDQTNLSVSDSNSSYSDDQIVRRRFTCVGVLPDESDSNTKEGLSNWITRSSMKNSGRRQSLEMLIDASDKVKDAFTTSFHKVGQKLERRNSESEMQSDNNSGIDFFSFSRSDKEFLTDEQVENLLLNGEDSFIPM